MLIRKNYCLGAMLMLASVGLTGVLADIGDVKWTFDVEDIITGSVAIDDSGNIYFGALDERVYSLDDSGALRWSRPTGDWVESSPALSADGNTLYIGSWDNKLYALSTSNGVVQWTYETDSLVFASPAVGDDGTIYFGSSDGFFYALNPNGTLKWEALIGGEIDSSPAIGADGGIYFGTSDGEVVALSSDGVEQWSYFVPTESGAEDRDTGVLSSPTLDGSGTVYFGSRNYFLYAVDSATGSLRWKFETGDSINTSVAVGIDGSLVFPSQDGFLYSLDANGVENWILEIGISFFSSPAVDALGRIYLGALIDGSNSSFCVISPFGQLLWHQEVADYIDTSPAISADGVGYFGSWDGHLYAVEVGAGLSSGVWPRFGRNNVMRASIEDYETPELDGERLVNISLRGESIPGESTISAGFVVSGENSKSVLIRSVGPGLEGFGIVGAMQNPNLLFYNGPDLIGENEDWMDSEDLAALSDAAERVGAFPLADQSKDSAALLDVVEGVYSGRASSADGSSGIVLVEVYDSDVENTDTRFANISMKGRVGTGQSVLVTGFAIKGNYPRKLLIRAVGKGLEQFVQSGVVQNPKLELIQSGRVLTDNDDWDTNPDRETLESVSMEFGAFPLSEGSRDSAIVVWLEPGSGYSARVSTVDGVSGTALIEVYDLGN